ncbi:unnamed protein product [Caenorhabditis auriculariae]|uniref:Dynein light chain n=1 Tax=Caenorhabditis auriculariae TaxID=2777116 RepID=A0A8S1HGT9_9PELO|nr:unnamed protein product [Caenorhabditis auriculariae]
MDYLLKSNEMVTRRQSFSAASLEDREKLMNNAKALRFELESRRMGLKDIVADVQHSNMPRHMEELACSHAAKAMQTYNLEHDIARYLKTAFDREFGPDWHCICGRHFGSFVTFEPNNFIYFRIGTIAFMLYKTTSSRLPIVEETLRNTELTPATYLVGLISSASSCH